MTLWLASLFFSSAVIVSSTYLNIMEYRMPAFPVQLPKVQHQYSSARPVVESASPTSCSAHATFRPKNYRYETVVRLENGQWSVVTTSGGHAVDDDYPVARGYEIAQAVINWWTKTFQTRRFDPLPPEVAAARATWLSRATHKLLTEVPAAIDQMGALHILASTYRVVVGSQAVPATLSGANWATAAHRNLERDLPESYRRGAVALLVEVVTGFTDPDFYQDFETNQAAA